MAKRRDALEVMCRLSPYNREDACVAIEDDTTVKAFAPMDTSRKDTNDRFFKFAKVFDGDTDQRRIFDETSIDLVEDVLKGKSSLLFTYGVTGGGKTYTLTGNSEQAGILQRCLDVLFNSIKNIAEKCVFQPNERNGYTVVSAAEAIEKRRANCLDTSFDICERVFDCRKVNGSSSNMLTSVFISFIEIYNNSVYDLFDKTSDALQAKEIRTNAHGQTYVDGCHEFEITSADEAIALFFEGEKRKRIASTLLNACSSRAHSIFNIRVVQAPFESNGSSLPTPDPSRFVVSQLSLVDLAGSERTKRTQNTGTKLAEANSINSSLLTLRMCMQKLRHNQRKRGNTEIVPYREAKLTYLLKNFFEGSGKVRMILCVNPRPSDYQENLNALEFGEEIRSVQISVATQLINDNDKFDIPRKFFVQWHAEAEQFDRSAELGAAPLPSMQMPIEPNINDNYGDYIKNLREWATARSQFQSAALLNLDQSAVKSEDLLKKALCQLDYYKKELDEMRKERQTDEERIDHLTAENRRAQREIQELRRTLRRYRQIEEEATVLDAERLQLKQITHQLQIQKQRAFTKINDVVENRSPTVNELRRKFTEAPNQRDENRRPRKATRRDDNQIGIGVAYYDPNYRRRSKSAPRLLAHNPTHHTPNGNILRPRMPPNTTATTTPTENDLRKSTEYVLTHEGIDRAGNITTAVVKGHVIPTAAGGSAVCFEDVEKLSHERLK